MQKIADALNLYSIGDENGAIELITEARTHFRRKQVKFLREIAVKDFWASISDLVNVCDETLHDLSCLVWELEMYSQTDGEKIDLDEASRRNWEIVAELKKADEEMRKAFKKRGKNLQSRFAALMK